MKNSLMLCHLPEQQKKSLPTYNKTQTAILTITISDTNSFTLSLPNQMKGLFEVILHRSLKNI
jgi:hypothetical protein